MIKISDSGFRTNQPGVGDEKISATVDPSRLRLHENAMTFGGLNVDDHVGHGFNVITHGVMTENDAAVFGHAARGDEGGAGILKLLQHSGSVGKRFGSNRPPITRQFKLGVVGDNLVERHRKASRRHPVRDALQLRSILWINARLHEPLGIGDKPGPLHAALMLPVRACHPEAFRDFLRQQVTVLETTLARPALDMEINPTRSFMSFRRAQPCLFLFCEAGCLKAGLKKNEAS